jgi:aspartate 1-decarboxylase
LGIRFGGGEIGEDSAPLQHKESEPVEHVRARAHPRYLPPMRRTICKSKIHRATITGAELNYEGSLTLDRALMDAADMLPYEQVQVVNVNNGARLETYLLPGERGSGVVQLNGAGARLGAPGDLVILMTYGEYEDGEVDDRFTPRVVFVDERNRVRAAD